MSPSNLSHSAQFWNKSLAEDLLRFLTSRTKCPETAADLTHETYLRLDRKVKEAPLDNARALAFHIALNLAIDYQRKASVRRRYAANIPLDSALEVVSGKSCEPEQVLMARQQLAQMQKALNELPENCRTAFYLQSTQGLKYSEIAAHMGISKSMVNRLLSQAMAYCAAQLDK